MKFSALTKALLNDEPSADSKSSTKPGNIGLGRGSGSVPINQGEFDRLSSRTDGPSPLPRRIVRLSGTPKLYKLRRSSSMSVVSAVTLGEESAPARQPLDPNTPVSTSRTVGPPSTTSYGHRVGTSSGEASSTKVASLGTGNEIDELPSTSTQMQPAVTQGSALRNGSSTMAPAKHGEESGVQSSIRVKGFGKMTGKFLKGPARRGKLRQDDEEQSPIEEHGDHMEVEALSQEPDGREGAHRQNLPVELGVQLQPPSKELRPQQALYPSKVRSGSPVSFNPDPLSSIMRSRPSPPAPAASMSRKALNILDEKAPAQPLFRIPAPRAELSSMHDQENDAPPTFKRNRHQSSFVDVLEKSAPSMVIATSTNAQNSPERRPLAFRSQNTPRRQAPPPPKMSIVETATSAAGAAHSTLASARRNRLRVNGKVFTRLDIIGRGGSSKVYRVMSENSKIWALKRVSLDDADELTIRGFKGEIDLLQKLKHVERVIQLIDYEMNDEKGILSVVSATIAYHTSLPQLTNVLVDGNGGT